MIDILFVFGDLFKRGGTETVMRNIFDHIDRDRFHIDFLLLSDEPDGTELTKHIEESGSKVFHIVRRGKEYSRHKKELKRFFSEHQYDIVHTHMDAIGDEALLEAKRNGVKVRVAHSHSTAQLPAPRSVKDIIHKGIILYERSRLRRLASHYVACSTEAGEWLFGKKRCSGDRYLLFRNAIVPEELIYSHERYVRAREELGISNEVLIGHVGAFLYQKNHEFLISVFADISKRIDSKLVLIGCGELEPDIRRKVNELGISDRVLFLGSRTDVKDLLQGMDVFVFPSHHEGLPLAVLEAQAAGLRCVISDRISREVDVTGLVVFLPINEGTGIWADAVEKAASSEDVRVSPVERIRESGYDMCTNIHELEDFYIRALN